MKSVKLILPMLAFLFAVVASFATQNVESNLALIDVSLPGVGECADIGACQTTGATTPCENPNGVEVIKFFPASGTCGFAFNGTWVN
jgi:hypothetical protein